ncbi:MAG: 4'-phosphopantetheinyl transferase superfamily protein [Chitinophagaceae bacterium]|nr:4'-phosphopantetheinyl transferase superfamily protein [Chitinophagaceae bacterium]
MPLFYQHNINATTKLGVWHIAEPEDFFLLKVPLQQNIRHPHKRLQHLAGRYLLRFLFPGFPNHLIEIADTRKPYLPDDAFHFSISHCGDYAAAIVSRSHRVGVDIEIPTTKITRVRHKFLHPDDAVALEKSSGIVSGGLPVADNPVVRKLTLLWSGKEAIFKWYGNGEVSFSDHIRIKPPEVALSIPGRGMMQGMFLKTGTRALTLPFVNFNELCLVWVVTE